MSTTDEPTPAATPEPDPQSGITHEESTQVAPGSIQHEDATGVSTEGGVEVSHADQTSAEWPTGTEDPANTEPSANE